MIKWLLKILGFSKTKTLKKDNSITENIIGKSSEKSLKSQIKVLNIYEDNFKSEEMNKLSEIKGDKFHFLIRRIGDVEFKDNFDLIEDEVFKIMKPKTSKFEYLYYDDKFIDGIRLDNGIEIGFSSEMVGIQIYFNDKIYCKEAVNITQELTQSLIEGTNKKAELWLVINESMIMIPD